MMGPHELGLPRKLLAIMSRRGLAANAVVEVSQVSVLNWFLPANACGWASEETWVSNDSRMQKLYLETLHRERALPTARHPTSITLYELPAFDPQVTLQVVAGDREYTPEPGTVSLVPVEGPYKVCSC